MKYEITKEQLQELAKGNAKVERWFPEAFKTKLEIGKWYVVDGDKCGQSGRKLLAYFSGIEDSNYGFCFMGIWSTDLTLNHKDLNTITFEAPESEVFEALKKEAVKRGFVDGVEYLSPTLNIHNVFRGKFEFDFNRNILFSGGIAIFNKGKWAEIIKEKTLSKSEAETMINEFKKDGYNYKIR